MARFYAPFNHSSVPIVALETITGTYGTNAICTSSANCYDRRYIGSSSTHGAALQSALVSTRSALSTQMMAQLDYANSIGVNGPIIPTDVIHHTGADLTWDNVYKTTTIPGVQWPSDPRVRPTGSIVSTAGNLTASSPVDSGTILYTYYTDATTAVNSAIDRIYTTDAGTTQGGPKSRTSNLSSRTLYSVWHDHALTYFAWDDFTPGKPGIVPGGVAVTSFNAEIKYGANTIHNGDTLYILSGDTIPYTFRWNRDLSDINTGWQYLNDAFALPIITADIHVYGGDGTPIQSVGPTQLSAGTTRYDWYAPTSALTSGTAYKSSFSVTFRDGGAYAETPSVNSDGDTTSTDGANFNLVRLYILGSGGSGTGLRKLTYNGGSGCYDMGTAATYYTDFQYFGISNGGTVNAKLFSTFDNIAPTAASDGLYVDNGAISGTQNVYSVAGGVVESITTNVQVF